MDECKDKPDPDNGYEYPPDYNESLQTNEMDENQTDEQKAYHYPSVVTVVNSNNSHDCDQVNSVEGHNHPITSQNTNPVVPNVNSSNLIPILEGRPAGLTSNNQNINLSNGGSNQSMISQQLTSVAGLATSNANSHNVIQQPLSSTLETTINPTMSPNVYANMSTMNQQYNPQQLNAIPQTIPQLLATSSIGSVPSQTIASMPPMISTSSAPTTFGMNTNIRMNNLNQQLQQFRRDQVYFAAFLPSRQSQSF
eukprot:CAMPEP_0201592914 /NCGR_PEP_ID=MMETSP0190_2-20130828/190667_1 /ASSEMBLY_ACC=CAM_ASM_000263 /TAXON_ID=37353 /ORGANISM="Rosalina sp." /LENGTH=251 /DNA_ID=CAMNT_0048051879 /DNA_START=1632 /DNA_END=2387 /DNA_ORIENTATION=-